MLNRNRVLPCFEQALRELESEGKTGVVRPRAVALRAHRIYCEGLPPQEKRPSPETFRKFACGSRAIPELAVAFQSTQVRASEHARVDREKLKAAFQKAVETLTAQETKKPAKPSLVARRAHELYLVESDPASSRPSYHTFRRLLYGKTTDPEIAEIILPAIKKGEPQIDFTNSVSPKRARLERKRIRNDFKKAVQAMRTDLLNGRAKPLHVARRAHAIHLLESDGSTPPPSVHTFERLVYGKTADPEIAGLIASSRPDPRNILKAFERALQDLSREKTDGLRPRTVAVRAYAIYCESLSPECKKPSLDTFRKLASGRRALPEVGELLEAANVKSAARATLDRERVREVFREAIQRLEARLFKGQASSSRIARRAYEIYTRETEEDAKPSRHTFQRLIYGKGADPEIKTLLRSALKNDGSES